jgi:2-polyprenyl-3-methyl-5-hydroxy-6-metoxy-1,4-benzoquinol methylase
MLKQLPTPLSSPPNDLKATVRLAYMAVLRREPDEGGLAAYVSALREGHDLAWLVGVLSRSDEFLNLVRRSEVLTSAPTEKQGRPACLLNQWDSMQIDARCSAAEIQMLWDHLAKTWSQLGDSEPYWSVLTDEKFRARRLGQEQLAYFYGTGNFEVRQFNACIQRAGLNVRPDAVCAEYGCGVGRVTHSLARECARVLAFDVSAPHLRTAQARMHEDGIQNVEFIHVTGKESLSALHDIDIFYSFIVLQHSPPPIILDVLEHAFSAIRPGGYAFFQVPTFSAEYSYSATAHVQQIAHGHNSSGGNPDDMEVHFVPQHMVLDLAYRAGLRTVEVQPDMWAGNVDRWISNTFLLARP